MAAATRLDFILVICLESVKYASHFISLMWVLLAPGNFDEGFFPLAALLNVASKDVQSLSLDKPWKSEIQNLRIEVQDSYFRDFVLALLPLHLIWLWNLHFIQQPDDVGQSVGQDYGGQFNPAWSVGLPPTPV
jgi:hypothetical protein